MIAVVLGRPISGGSALAAAIVAMGYHPGRTIFGPCAPSFRLDWEDSDLTPALIAGTRPNKKQWERIIDVRLEQASVLGCAGVLMKSPTLCLAGRPFFQALDNYRNEIFWISRDEAERQEALKSYPPETQRTLNEIDREIIESNVPGPDLDIDYADLIEDPVPTLTLVTQMLGAEDRLSEAVAAIGPRRLAVWHSSQHP